MAWKPGQAHDTIKLGEDFELRDYQLRRSWRVVKLEPTPMLLLLFLIEHKGELVTRDQIVEKIWGKGVFLDTDDSINGAIRKIRQVLRDNPEQPRFVQTVKGKGYRFIAPVIEPETNEQQEDTNLSSGAAGVEAALNLPGKRWKVLAASLAVLALCIGGLVWLYSRRTPKLTDKDTIVLADFTNATGDPGDLRWKLPFTRFV